MAHGLSYDELKALDPCKESLVRVRKLMGGAKAWDGRSITAAEARERGATLEDIVWAASAVARSNPDAQRRLRLWIADCAAWVLHIYEDHVPGDARPRNAIVVARQFARGEVDAAAMAAARAAARAAVWDAARDAAWDATRAARDVEKNWKFDRLVAWLSDQEPEDWPLPGESRKEQR